MTRYAGKGTHQRIPREGTSWEELKATPAKKKRFNNNDRANFKGRGGGGNKNFSRGGGGNNFRKSYEQEEVSANFIQLGDNAKPFGSCGKKTVQGHGQSKQVKVDGQFWVPVEDAKRLKQLGKKLKDEGMSKKEISEALKNERRKAEKAARRARDKTCFNCRQFGHVLFDCPNKGTEKDNVDGLSTTELLAVGAEICFKCGSTEHTSRYCKKSADKFDFAKCFICSKTGHIARQCPQNSKGIYPAGGCCNQCGETTHLIKDCPTLFPDRGDGEEQEKDIAVTSIIVNPFVSPEYEGEASTLTKEPAVEGTKKSKKLKRPSKDMKPDQQQQPSKKRRVKF